MTTMDQTVRVIRRKLIDRVRSTGVCGAGVRGYEAASAPAGDGVHGIVVTGTDGRVVGASLTAVHLWQPFTIHFLYSLPLQDTAESEQVDPRLSDARDTCLAELLAPVTYGDGIEIDPAGHSGGDPISWSAGYLDWDGTKYRTATISLGIVAYNAMETTR
jgi:hypothetical protein